jgi:hypothetical protein
MYICMCFPFLTSLFNLSAIWYILAKFDVYCVPLEDGPVTLWTAQHLCHLNTLLRHNVCKHMVLQITDKCYKYIPERALNVNGTTIIWGRTILANWPDIVPHDNREKTCLMIDTAIPNDSNINTKGTEKLSKYKNLEIRVSRMWKVRTKLCQL